MTKDYIFVKVVKLKGDKKKYSAVFKNRKTGRIRNVKFGSNIPYMEDYTIHKDAERKKRFLDRFNKTIKKNINNPLSPMWWSTNLLWNRPSYAASLKDVKIKLKNLGYL